MNDTQDGNLEKELAICIPEKQKIHQPFYLGIRKHGHRVLLVPCPFCDNVFTVREDSYNSGATKSCGCLRREKTKLVGAARKGKTTKRNKYQKSWVGDYVRVFYEEIDNYFIVSKNDFDDISQYFWRPWQNGGRIEPYTIINGKRVLLSRMLMKTPKELQCDHIDGCPRNNLRENLRNCTQQQNLLNRKCAEGVVYQDKKSKYRIKGLWGVDTKQMQFETEEEANNTLVELRDKYQGEFSYPASQKLAQKHETYEFKKVDWVEKWLNQSILRKILKLPPDNPLNARLRDLIVILKNERISCFFDELEMELSLKEDYRKFVTANGVS